MNKKGQLFTVFVGAMVVLVIAVIALNIIQSQYNTQTTTTAVANDQFVATNGTCVQVTTSCVGSLTSVTNDTTATDFTGNFSICGDNPDYNGLLLSATANGNLLDGETLNASYSEISCEQLTGTTSTIVSYVPLLFAVGIFVFAAALIK